MHKNIYNEKTLISNWQEERQSEAKHHMYDENNTQLPNPSYNKYIPISKDIGTGINFTRVSYLATA